MFHLHVSRSLYKFQVHGGHLDVPVLQPNGTTFYQSEKLLMLPPKFPGFFSSMESALICIGNYAAFSARSILDSTVSCDVTERYSPAPSQTSGRQRVKRERHGTRLCKVDHVIKSCKEPVCWVPWRAASLSDRNMGDNLSPI